MFFGPCHLCSVSFLVTISFCAVVLSTVILVEATTLLPSVMYHTIPSIPSLVKPITTNHNYLIFTHLYIHLPLVNKIQLRTFSDLQLIQRRCKKTVNDMRRHQ
jgi:hypothetical protein